MENKKVSVIMPIYNSAKFLDRSIGSILQQTYTNIELILINDGSIDESGRICEEYSKKDSRIIYKSQNNHGQGYSRSLGVKIATGDYIAFVDSDDYCDTNMYEIMVDAIEKDNADLCVCQWNYELPDGTHTIDKHIYDDSFYGVMSSINFAHYLYKYTNIEAGTGYANGLVVSSWNKLYKSEIIKGFSCEGYLGEDEEMNDWINSKDIVVTIIRDELYYYRQNLESISNKPFSEKKYNILSMLNKRCSLFEDSYIKNKTRALYCNLFIEFYYKAEKLNINLPDSNLYTIFKIMFRNLVVKRQCTLKFFIRMLLFIYSKKLYKRVILNE